MLCFDGNFAHKHRKSKRDSAALGFNHQFIVPADFIDCVGSLHKKLSKKDPTHNYQSEAPFAATKLCDKSHVVADESRAKAGGDVHDNQGLFAVLCRHDQPLFIGNIDTPGEGMRYVMASIFWAVLHLPKNATVCTFYDMNCMAEKILKMVSTAVNASTGTHRLVRYYAARHGGATGICDFRSSCLHTCVGVPACFQSTAHVRLWPDRR